MIVCRMKFGFVPYLILIFLSTCSSKSIKVIVFKNDSTREDGREKLDSQGPFVTRHFSFCLRLMPRYHSPYTLIATSQIRLLIRGLKTQVGFITYINQLPDSSSSNTWGGSWKSNGSYSRMFQFCQSREAGKWTSLCFSMELNDGSQHLKIFQNGHSCYNETFSDGYFHPLRYQKRRPIKDIIYFGKNQNPHGMITQLHFWSRILSDEEMHAFTGNCNFILNQTDLYFDWNNIDSSTINPDQMEIRSYQFKNTCQENRSTSLLLGRVLRYHDAKKICTHLSGSMSMNPGGKREYILGDIENCFSPDSGEIRFWIPVKQGQSVKGTNGQYLWLDDRPNSNGTVVQAQTWNTGQPNGLHIQQCVDASEQGNWYDMECEETKRCSVCVIPVAQIFRLRGQHNFEQEYSLSFEMQKSTKRVIFEGLEQSSIVIWYPMEEKTELIDQEQNVTTTFYQNPFGLLGSRKDIIRNDGYTDQLVFTNCNSKNQFTCWDGECIHLTKMCDGIKDCKYGRDEYACRYIKIEKDQYRRTDIPSNPNEDGPLQVTIGIHIEDIVYINEPKMYFSLKFRTWVKWRDIRLNYENLKRETYLNGITGDTATKLWKPVLIFENHNEKDKEMQLLKYDPHRSIMMLKTKGLGEEAPLSKIYEATLFNSNETDIIWRSRYFVKLKCNFKLYFFPFDNQTCYLKLIIPETWRNKMTLTTGELSLNMTRTLNNFMVTDSSLQSPSKDRIYLVINIERISAPFWISLFLPSICLVFAAEITLFIDETHFKATISVALTSNLVMYTLYRTIQEKLPEKSTLKLIDIWLLHGLLMPMVVFMILATKELIIHNRPAITIATPQPKIIKIADSAVSASQQINTEANGVRKYLFYCQTVVPAFSVIFIATFFFVMFNKI